MLFTLFRNINTSLHTRWEFLSDCIYSRERFGNQRLYTLTFCTLREVGFVFQLLALNGLMCFSCNIPYNSAQNISASCCPMNCYFYRINARFMMNSNGNTNQQNTRRNISGGSSSETLHYSMSNSSGWSSIRLEIKLKKIMFS